MTQNNKRLEGEYIFNIAMSYSGLKSPILLDRYHQQLDWDTIKKDCILCLYCKSRYLSRKCLFGLAEASPIKHRSTGSGVRSSTPDDDQHQIESRPSKKPWTTRVTEGQPRRAKGCLKYIIYLRQDWLAPSIQQRVVLVSNCTSSPPTGRANWDSNPLGY